MPVKAAQATATNPAAAHPVGQIKFFPPDHQLQRQKRQRNGQDRVRPRYRHTGNQRKQDNQRPLAFFTHRIKQRAQADVICFALRGHHTGIII